METPDVLRVHVLIDSLGMGGAEFLLGEFASGAAAAGIELSVGYLQEAPDDRAARRLREQGLQPVHLPVTSLVAPGGYLRIRRHLRAARPDVVHTHLGSSDCFYEELFGHVPVAEINNAWFQYVLHPRFRPDGAAAKRVFDAAVAVAIAILLAPVLAVAALLIAADGRSPIFRQVRIGAGGRPFVMYKLRTMGYGRHADPRWATADDARVTRIGRILRATHVDELPQLLNVLRGEMSIVGPRPEQPHYVRELERTVPFYSRRMLLKPGLTGWAQVHCGYAGSELGTLHKICHDLYYVKHRSLRFDMRILFLTFGAVMLDRRRQFREIEGVAPFALERRFASADPGLAAVDGCPSPQDVTTTSV